ncbi:protein phosphatase 1H-like isoform X2 [Lineus longissimus]|uniref:protein phosphatase 1H-like isoform X2 n=1 Tax=Lineus longissimus TaxID=88925 RepID=UPI00315CFBAD
MFSRFRNVVANVMGGIAAVPHHTEIVTDPEGMELKYRYNRPEFMQLTDDEVQVSADHHTRPVLVPRDMSKLLWHSGYAEVINAGKSSKNEDQAGHTILHIKRDCYSPTTSDTASISSPFGAGPPPLPGKQRPIVGENSDAVIEHTKQVIEEDESIHAPYFAIFDGHAGTGAALTAVNLLHRHVEEKLSAVKPLIMKKYLGQQMNGSYDDYNKFGPASKEITIDNLVIGALETAFLDMDAQIARERTTFKIPGGCTALVALFFLGKLYLANAGDSRAVICRGQEVIEMSHDFTPISERKRLQYLAYLQPELLANEFTYLEFPRRVHKRDVGKRMLYRDAEMSGWAYKTIAEDDLKFPLIFGEGKRSRVLGTIGVTRGLGDHDLQVYDSKIHVKPFLSPIPEVKVFDLMTQDLTSEDVIVMACDGLWDVISNQECADIVNRALSQSKRGDLSRYTSVAQELVVSARGMPKARNWIKGEGQFGSGDDISVLVIPLLNYKQGEQSRVNAVTPSQPQSDISKTAATGVSKAPERTDSSEDIWVKKNVAGPTAGDTAGTVHNRPVDARAGAVGVVDMTRNVNGSKFYATKPLSDAGELKDSVS